MIVLYGGAMPRWVNPRSNPGRITVSDLGNHKPVGLDQVTSKVRSTRPVHRVSSFFPSSFMGWESCGINTPRQNTLTQLATLPQSEAGMGK